MYTAQSRMYTGELYCHLVSFSDEKWRHSFPLRGLLVHHKSVAWILLGNEWAVQWKNEDAIERVCSAFWLQKKTIVELGIQWSWVASHNVLEDIPAMTLGEDHPEEYSEVDRAYQHGHNKPTWTPNFAT